MNSRRYALPALLAAVLWLAPALVAQTGTPAQPPVTKKVPKESKLQGELRDDYFWLREKENPEVIDYLEAENAYTDAVMAPTRTSRSRSTRRSSAASSRPTRACRTAAGLLLLHPHRGGQAVSQSSAGRRAAAMRPRRSISTSTSWPRASNSWRWARSL